MLHACSHYALLSLCASKFARLLFDRMLESFRRSSELSLGLKEQDGLGDLLPSIFGGTFNYVTECRECGHKSTRKEDFMDISVPIVDLKEEKPPSGGRKAAKTKQAGDTTDVDIQLCLNSYLRRESLEGENQYDCSG